MLSFDLFFLMHPSGKAVNGECGGNRNDAIDGLKWMQSAYNAAVSSAAGKTALIAACCALMPSVYSR